MNSIERLKQFVEEDLIYQAYKKRNGEPNNGFERQCFVHCRDIENVLNVLDEIIEYIKYNATSNYFDADTNMFRREVDILQIIDKVKK